MLGQRSAVLVFRKGSLRRWLSALQREGEVLGWESAEQWLARERVAKRVCIVLRRERGKRR